MTDSIVKIRCGEHGARLAYITCRHVLDASCPQRVAKLSEPNIVQPGECLCAACDVGLETDVEKRDEIVDGLVLVCSECIPGVVARAGRVGA